MQRRDLASTDPQSFMELNGIKPVKGLVNKADYDSERIKPRAKSIEDAASMKAFENDLKGMREKEVKEAIREAQSQLDEIEPWLEALYAYARACNINGV